MGDKEKITLTEADTQSYDHHAQLLKAAMAYVSPSMGKMMAIMAKSIELQHMMQFLNQEGVSACSVQKRSIPPEEIIRDLRKYCGTREREQIDRCLNLMQMAKMASMMSSMSSYEGTASQDVSGNEEDYIRKMQAMLTPEQIQLIRNMEHQQHT